jgi:hypothetical protein
MQTHEKEENFHRSTGEEENECTIPAVTCDDATFIATKPEP